MMLTGQAVATFTPLPLPVNSVCRHDRATVLALDERAFDQDLAGGWQALSNKGCEGAAADLIRDYRHAHPPSPTTFLSFWHEGQLRANIGQTDRAIALFYRARKTDAEDRGFGWNLYVDGSVAFLRRDRPALQMARDRLAALPMPAGYGANIRKPDGSIAKVAWPMNLNVLDGLLRCFEKDYRTAYGSTCSAPLFRFTKP